MRCPNCNERRNAENSKYCFSCGEFLRTGVQKRKDNQPEESTAEMSEGRSGAPRRSLFGKRGDSKEESQDLAYGQHVIIAARWILVATGLMLALWSPLDIVDLRVQIVVILGLAAANFYLHTQVLMRRPLLTSLVYAASAVDLVAITMIILSQDGAASQLYVFYFPAILAFSVAFRPQVTLAYAGAAIAAYGLIYFATGTFDNPEVIVVRLLMLAAVAVCGTVYWSNERKRRHATQEVGDQLRAQVR